ncbi:MAG: inositol monophosphatase family protein [Bryobacteraceae bacterium]
MPYDKELAAARNAMERAGAKALEYWRSGIEADAKSDDSPVTAADRECERLLVQDLCAQYPDDGILGEEGAEKASGSGRRWIVDPIDGTRDFVRGNRLWSMLLALEDSGDVVVGVAYFPALGEMYWAEKGRGAWRTPQKPGSGEVERLRVSSVKEIGQAVFCLNAFTNVQRSAFSRNLLDWLRHFWAVRSLGGALDAMMVAAGSADAWIEQSAKPWDLAAIKIIAEEAGARFFNFDGGDSIYGGNCVLCVPALETAMRRFVNS